MEVALDTGMDLGVISSKRDIVIEDPRYGQIYSDYVWAASRKNSAGMDRAVERLMRVWFKGSVRPGQVCRIDSARQVNCGTFPGSDALSAEVKWLPGDHYLRVTADVVDRNFSTDCPAGEPWEASCFEILVSPRGVPDSINQFFIIPRGNGGVPEVQSVHTERESDVIAAFKRTAVGYRVEVKIPYSVLRGYRPGWTVLPVEATVNSKTPGGRVQLIMTEPAEPGKDARGYAGLAIR